MRWIDSEAALAALYGQPGAPALRKVVPQLTPLYRRWIMASRFCLLSTVGPEGIDGSPRGDDGPVVLELDPGTLAMPDWRGNNRLDSLRNIVRDPRVALLFLIPGSTTAVRINGRAGLTDDAALRARFDRQGTQPATVIVVQIAEVYTQCARALLRAGLWTRDDAAGLPSVGDLLAEATAGQEGGAPYDADWPSRAAKTMW